MEQIFIFALGVSAMFLVGRTGPERKWGFILGLLSQPFWFYTSYKHQQWGMFFLTFAYTITWILGIYNEWVVKRKIKENDEWPSYDELVWKVLELVNERDKLKAKIKGSK